MSGSALISHKIENLFSCVDEFRVTFDHIFFFKQHRVK